MSAPPSPDSQLQQLDQDTTLEPVQSLNSKLDRLFLPDMATEAPIAVATSSTPASTVNEEKRWTYLDNIRKNPGPFSDPDVAGTPEAFEQFDKMKVLVIGAGGLGCEILKNLAMSKFKDIHVIDMDTIDISNLNRQFLFRQSDVGKSKSECAAQFVMRRVKGVTITAHNCRIQDFDADFYKQFQLVICGLDSIEARRWINAMLVSIAEAGEDADCLIPLIDGGTEGFKGQARVVIPSMTSCIECQLDMHAPRAAVPLCTIASIPRQPEHCIEWAHVIAWDQEKPFPQLDKDDPAHVSWLYQKALARAEEFKISGVTYALTQGVIKNIIPAIASTNAIIAASCCNEAFKLASSAAPTLGMEENYMMYSGNDSVYTYTFRHEKKDDCPVCGQQSRPLEVDPNSTLQELVDSFATRPEAQLKKPSLRGEGKTLYMQFPPSLEEKTRPNLEKTIKELGLEDGQNVIVTDPAFPLEFNFYLRFKGTA
ncbi:NEDD8-activating enzyme E1 catalytic subunit [Colletotrichum siamense]|uniref:NEDD8-activating enzyme E1 catalytic subunit n=1 Tax=Colletotrichum siamense TaxID=690259 RepID=A0A9P5K286_COLSI|nr:NEDD8-activating enzyme E1 catalytic subunit [Colletotrichum siamense]KAF4855536.1 NEDD8-activating enzyme E1 catalytic subunit [Colletotrichum siamense]